MNKKLLEALTAKCKDMGLSAESVEQIAGIASNGLADDATDEDIAQRVNQYEPVMKAMQAEATRWAQKRNGQTTVTPPKPKPQEADDVVAQALAAMEEKYGATLTQQSQTIEQLKQQLTASERNTVIAGVMKKYGLTDKDMEFVTVPADANVDEYLGKYKQSLVDRGLKPADPSVAKEAKDKAESEFAESMLKEFGVSTE